MTFEMYLIIAQGNPGAITVLRKLEESNGEDWVRKLCVRMIETVSSGYCLWLLFKDECDYDISKTKEVLDRWMKESDDSLNEWIKTNFPKSAVYVID